MFHCTPPFCGVKNSRHCSAAISNCRFRWPCMRQSGKVKRYTRRKRSGWMGMRARMSAAWAIILSRVSDLISTYISLFVCLGMCVCGCGMWDIYPVILQPLMKPSRVNSPIDGDLSSSAIPRHATSSRPTLMSPRYFIAPSMPIPSGLSSGASGGG